VNFAVDIRHRRAHWQYSIIFAIFYKNEVLILEFIVGRVHQTSD
jgi:hypothetical protein